MQRGPANRLYRAAYKALPVRSEPAGRKQIRPHIRGVLRPARWDRIRPSKGVLNPHIYEIPRLQEYRPGRSVFDHRGVIGRTDVRVGQLVGAVPHNVDGAVADRVEAEPALRFDMIPSSLADSDTPVRPIRR